MPMLVKIARSRRGSAIFVGSLPVPPLNRFKTVFRGLDKISGRFEPDGDIPPGFTNTVIYEYDLAAELDEEIAD